MKTITDGSAVFTVRDKRMQVKQERQEVQDCRILQGVEWHLGVVPIIVHAAMSLDALSLTQTRSTILQSMGMAGIMGMVLAFLLMHLFPIPFMALPIQFSPHLHGKSLGENFINVDCNLIILNLLYGGYFNV